MAWLEDSMQSQNGAFVIDPKTGLEEKYYAKTKLVPFGEYVPAWASWIGKVVPVGNMKRGDSFEPLEICLLYTSPAATAASTTKCADTKRASSSAWTYW